MRCAVSPCSSLARMISRYASQRLRDAPVSGLSSPAASAFSTGGDPVGALVSFDSAEPGGALVSFEPSDPAGALPGGALVSFDDPLPKCRRTALRLIDSVAAICRSERPAASKLLIACTLSIASWFAMSRLCWMVGHAKPPSEPIHSTLVQLVSFEAPRAGLL